MSVLHDVLHEAGRQVRAERLPHAVVRAARRRARHRGAVPRRWASSRAQTTADGEFTLIEVECLGACDRAPVVMVNDDWHERLAPEQVAAVRRRPARRAAPRRSPAVICTWRRRGRAIAWRSNPSSPRTSASPTPTRSTSISRSARLRGAAQGADAEAERHHRAGEGVGAARPRRRRLPDRAEVAVRPQGHAQAEVHLPATPTRASRARSRITC